MNSAVRWICTYTPTSKLRNLAPNRATAGLQLCWGSNVNPNTIASDLEPESQVSGDGETIEVEGIHTKQFRFIGDLIAAFDAHKQIV